MKLTFLFFTISQSLSVALLSQQNTPKTSEISATSPKDATHTTNPSGPMKRGHIFKHYDYRQFQTGNVEISTIEKRL